MELELIMLFIRQVLHLKDHGLRLHLPILLIWLTQMDIYMELEVTMLFIELCQIPGPGLSLLMGLLQR